MKRQIVTVLLLFISAVSIAQIKDWKLQNSGTSQTLWDVDFVNDSTGWVVGDSGYVLHTTDGGANWTKQNTLVTQDLIAVDFIDENIGWAVGESGVILHTTNGGSFWGIQTSGTTDKFMDIQAFDANRAYAIIEDPMTFSSKNAFFKTVDGGTNWVALSTGTGAPYGYTGIYFKDSLTGWTTTNFYSGSQVVKTEDAGGSFSVVPTNTWYVNTFHFPNDSVGYYVDGGNGVYKSVDSGNSWNYVANLPYPDGFDMVFFDEANGYIHTNQRILHTLDSGKTWDVIGSWPGSTILQDMHIESDSKGWAVGYYGQIWSYIPHVEENLTGYLCNGDSTEVRGQMYGSAGFYEDSAIVASAQIPDTLFTIFIDTASATQSTFSAENCNAYVSPGGKTWTTSGIYEDTLVNAKGCDSIITIDLTIYSDTTVEINETITTGEVFEFAGTNLDVAGTYSDSLTSSHGCDSIITLNLTVVEGLEDLTYNKVHVFPNPANSQLTFQSNADLIMEVRILDLSGRAIKHWSLAGLTETISVAELENGTYLSQVTLKNGETLVNRFTKL